MSSGQTKRLTAPAVARQDKGRDKAELAQGRRGPGRPRKDGFPAQARPKSVEEARDRVITEVRREEAKAETQEREFRPPTNNEKEMVRRFLDMSNKPLVQLERQFAEMGVVGADSPPFPVKFGEIPATPDELDCLAECTAGTLVNFAPSFMAYMYPIGLVLGGVAFLGARLLIYVRIKRMADEAQANAEREAKRAAQSKTAPTATPPANGAHNVTPMPART